MKKNAVMLLGFALISMNANSIEKPLLLTTTIDINNLYADSITNVEFEPATLELSLNSDNTSFETALTALKISTNIPKDVSSIPYSATMIQNTSSCTNFTGEEFPQLDNDSPFVRVKFEGSEVSEDVPVEIDDFNLDDGTYKTSEHDIALEFKPFSELEINGSPKECSGEIVFSIGVDI